MVNRLASHYLDNVPEVDVVILLPHPGDAEYYCGGTIAKLAHAGRSVAILDLTAGEAGSYSRAEIKLDEADVASAALGVVWRACIRFPDGRLEDTIMSRMTVIGEIMRLSPKTVFSMNSLHAHPDSMAASVLVENACYLAGLSKLDDYLLAHRPERVVFAGGAASAAPSFVVDITDFMEQKLTALRAYTTLFADPEAEIGRVEREALRIGELVGVQYGEAFVQRQPLCGDLL